MREDGLSLNIAPVKMTIQAQMTLYFFLTLCCRHPSFLCPTPHQRHARNDKSANWPLQTTVFSTHVLRFKFFLPAIGFVAVWLGAGPDESCVLNCEWVVFAGTCPETDLINPLTGEGYRRCLVDGVTVWTLDKWQEIIGFKCIENTAGTWPRRYILAFVKHHTSACFCLHSKIRVILGRTLNCV